jgi:hypothetical protein
MKMMNDSEQLKDLLGTPDKRSYAAMKVMALGQFADLTQQMTVGPYTDGALISNIGNNLMRMGMA